MTADLDKLDAHRDDLGHTFDNERHDRLVAEGRMTCDDTTHDHEAASPAGYDGITNYPTPGDNERAASPAGAYVGPCADCGAETTGHLPTCKVADASPTPEPTGLDAHLGCMFNHEHTAQCYDDIAAARLAAPDNREGSAAADFQTKGKG